MAESVRNATIGIPIVSATVTIVAETVTIEVTVVKMKNIVLQFCPQLCNKNMAGSATMISASMLPIWWQLLQ